MNRLCTRLLLGRAVAALHARPAAACALGGLALVTVLAVLPFKPEGPFDPRDWSRVGGCNTVVFRCPAFAETWCDSHGIDWRVQLACRGQGSGQPGLNCSQDAHTVYAAPLGRDGCGS